MKYYVLQVITGNEEKFRRQFLNNHKKKSSGSIDVLLPRRVLTIKKAGKKSEREVPLFPGYVFIACDGFSASILNSAAESQDFVRILPESKNPLELSTDEKEIIQKITAKGEIIAKSGAIFDENNRIKVINGPLAGLEGNIIRVDRRKGRAKVELSLYENTFSIDFGFEDLNRQDKKENE